MDKYEQHQQLCDLIHNTYIQKNKAYGNSFGDTFAKLGVISAITRITDKYNRIVNLAVNPSVDVGDESMIDSLLDLANYALMTVMELQNTKEDPFE